MAVSDVVLDNVCVNGETLIFESPVTVTVSKHGAVYYIECDELFLLSISKEIDAGLRRLQQYIYDMYYGKYEDDAPEDVRRVRSKFLSAVSLIRSS